MNIDKFGHHVHKRLRYSNNITGEINLQSRLKGLKRPTAADEAVNKEYVDHIVKSYITKQDLYAEIQKLNTAIESVLLQCNQKYFTKAEITALFTRVSKQQ